MTPTDQKIKDHKVIAIAGNAHLYTNDSKGETPTGQAVHKFYKHLDDQGIKYISLIPTSGTLSVLLSSINAINKKGVVDNFDMVEKTFQLLNSNPIFPALSPSSATLVPIHPETRNKTISVATDNITNLGKTGSYSLTQLNETIQGLRQILLEEFQQIELEMQDKGYKLSAFERIKNFIK